MADLKQCDVCKRISPDEKGLFIANHWVCIKAEVKLRTGYEENHLVCDACFKQGIKISFNGVQAHD